ncbi:unnamed protein product [Ranitomeya imitator]|uniref:protein-tyrosine-phosphatase n=1 Tax=Ranitomeya imitator TaxID=111125 RepID=A0ABN9KUT1_9NEOB|nr:unnamed protein product [Ranitomeya imitator]
MLERIKHEKTVDIYGHVTLMRSQRNYMVQTEDQYSFIHDALFEAVACGNTEVPARNLYTYIQKLAQIETGEHVTGMELEFKRLANSKAHTSRFISANLPCNKFKNRLVNIMPYETTRVCLQPIRGVEGSDYINASFIDGYRQQKAYIATQGPLAETTEDFWRMLWENNSTIVVMLTKLREMGREKCHQYWPAERSARYQYFVVDPMAEYNMPQYILREFKVTDARTLLGKVLGIPVYTADQLVGQCGHYQSQLPENKSVGTSTSFITVIADSLHCGFLLEQVKIRRKEVTCCGMFTLYCKTHGKLLQIRSGQICCGSAAKSAKFSDDFDSMGVFQKQVAVDVAE